MGPHPFFCHSPTVRLPTLIAALLLAAALPARAERALPPPGLVEELETLPEDPLPPEPEELPEAPIGPLVTAPDANGLLTECKQDYFTDCYRMWEPPAPPPEPEKAKGTGAPSAPDPAAPLQPARGGPLDAPPPGPTPAQAAADRATYEALMQALKATGLEGKILVSDPPKAAEARPPATTQK